MACVKRSGTVTVSYPKYRFDLVDFGRWFITFGIVGFIFGTLPIVRYSKILATTTFRKLDLFASSGDGVGDTYCIGSVRNT
jgi:hypothetical protein